MAPTKEKLVALTNNQLVAGLATALVVALVAALISIVINLWNREDTLRPDAREIALPTPNPNDYDSPITCPDSGHSQTTLVFSKDGRNVLGCPTVRLDQNPSNNKGAKYQLSFERCLVDQIDVDYGSDGTVDLHVPVQPGSCPPNGTVTFTANDDGSASVTLTATRADGGDVAYWVAGHRN